MITDTRKRQQIVRKIYRISSDKLSELDDFVSKLEKPFVHNSKSLSFAGAWNDIEDSIFDDLTINLIGNRERNERRFNE